MKKNIILGGFMGCGKSTVGLVLSKLMNMKLVDTDKLIEEEFGIDIKTIFSRYGEDYFRNKEYEICCKVAKEENTVVCTGGGVLTFERNCNVLKENGIIVFIETPFNVIMKRLSDDTTRPLIDQKNLNNNLDLYNRRLPLYKDTANLIVDGDNSPEVIAEKIMNSVNL